MSPGRLRAMVEPSGAIREPASLGEAAW